MMPPTDLSLCPRCKNHSCRLKDIGRQSPVGTIPCYRYCITDGCDYEHEGYQLATDVEAWSRKDQALRQTIMLEADWLAQFQGDITAADFIATDFR